MKNLNKKAVSCGVVRWAGSIRRPINQIAPDVARFIAVGASPRATLAIARAAQALAYLRGRDFVSPDDILDIAPDCLRHRLKCWGWSQPVKNRNQTT